MADPPADRVWHSEGTLSVLGTGHALPGAPVDNAVLIARAGLSGRRAALAHKIAERLGIETRHVSRSWAARVDSPQAGMGNADLAARALDAALGAAGLAAGDLGYLIGHTATPEWPLPANIALVADRIGYTGPHVELRQACTGFANALMIAFGLLARPDARPVAIVGSETGSLFLDVAGLDEAPGQMVNLMQMGDGAGAIILGPAGGGGDATISGAWFGADGLGRAPGLMMPDGGSRHPAAAAGAPLSFEHDFAGVGAAGARLFEAGVRAAGRHIALSQADHIIPHQASGRIGAQLAAHFALPPERLFVSTGRVGNTGSAAIWIALDQLRRAGAGMGGQTLVLGAEATKYMHGGFIHATPGG